MAVADLRDRLQPALLDRLCDDAPANRTEADAQRVMSRSQLRQAVLRDLSWLFNAVQPLGPLARQYPGVEGSVLNYGLPALSGRQVSRLDIHQLRRDIGDAILRYEPRILRETLEVTVIEMSSVLDTHNCIEFEIRGQLWGQPLPLDLLLRTSVDLEAGLVEVRDAAAAPSAVSARP